MFITRLVLTLLLFHLFPVSASADEDVFARQGDVVLTQAELDAAFMRIPENVRLPFIRDGERVDRLVQNLLRYKQTAAEAVENEFDDNAEIQLRVKLAGEQELAEAWVQQLIADMPQGDYEQLAYENYLANPENYRTPAAVDVSHILVSSENRPDEEALETVNRLHAELVENPALFDEYIDTWSEDPAKASNQGRYAHVIPGQMVKPFENVAFSLEENGEISEPVRTAYGFHIIRLNGKIPPGLKPFDSVKAPLIMEARGQQVQAFRTNYLKRLAEVPIEIPDGAIEAMAKRHFGENLERAPDFYNQ
jgi:peptidyl-prolyl cis-trans isomerase C